MIEPSDRQDAIDSTEAAEAIEPTDSTEPTEPIDSTEPLEAMHNSESSDHSDHWELLLSMAWILSREIDRSFSAPPGVSTGAHPKGLALSLTKTPSPQERLAPRRARRPHVA
jgi:hypothetical protein